MYISPPPLTPALSIPHSAVNRGGSRRLNVTVRVNVPPAAALELSDHFSVRGKPIGIYCHVVRGTPNPTVTWRFNGEQVHGDEGPSISHPEFRFNDNGHSIEIHQAQTSFSGNYSCIASNVAGESVQKSE